MFAQLTHQVTQVETTELERGWPRSAWSRIRMFFAETHYASRRLVEVQAPWINDPHWDRR
jgi:hypothetical protein